MGVLCLNLRPAPPLIRSQHASPFLNYLNKLILYDFRHIETCIKLPCILKSQELIFMVCLKISMCSLIVSHKKIPNKNYIFWPDVKRIPLQSIIGSFKEYHCSLICFDFRMKTNKSFAQCFGKREQKYTYIFFYY